jgi:hypothetical protein
MGFRHWLQGFELICMFLVAVALPCFFTGLWGTRMINELGNHPSMSARIQAAAGGKIMAVQVVSFIILVGLYIFLFNVQFS